MTPYTKRPFDKAEERATAWLSDLAKRNGIDASAVNVIIGTPAVEIRRMAEKLDADLIVLGTHGRHDLGLMLGSTANAVLHGAPCNVLAIKCAPMARRNRKTV
jgi:universal stress protein A